MATLTLADVVQATNGEIRGSQAAVRFTRVVSDSRQVVPGSLFVALPGAKHDGHDFVAHALADGAQGALVQHVPVDCAWATAKGRTGPPLVLVGSTPKALAALAHFLLERHPLLEVAGVTGSLGKTTTKEVVASVLSRRYPVLKSEGNLNSEIGLPLTLINGLMPEHRLAVLEMGMYAPGDIRLLAEITRPRIGIVTAVLAIHLSRLGSIENIQRAKQELINALPADGLAVLNADDDRVSEMGNATSARVLRYGVAPNADVRASNIESRGLRGVDFDVTFGGHTRQVHLPMLGEHSVHAALAAVAVATARGFSLGDAAEALHDASPALRLVVVDGINGSRIVDDTYNASPESMLAALNLLRELPGKRKIAVLGDMLELGREEAAGHRRVGNRAAGILDLLVTCGERARGIATEARAMGLPQDQVVESNNIDEIVALLVDRLRPGDDVLVKGSRALGLDAVVRAIRAEQEN